MDAPTFTAILNDLNSDIPAPNFWGKLLAHYTTLSALEGIATTKEIWFSHPFVMNDHEEVAFGLNLGTTTIMNSAGLKTALGSPARVTTFVDSFLGYRTHYDQNFLFDTYVFCLSDHDPDKDDDGRLSMWRAYGGDGAGAAIIFDTTKLTSVQSSPLILDEVKYLSSTQRQLWADGFVARIGALAVQYQITDADLPILARLAFERLTLAAIFSKHEGFSEEREYRVVYMPERDPQGNFRQFLHYHIGPRSAEPRLRMKLAPLPGVLADDLSLEKLVHHIILGPSRTSPLALGSTARMLGMHGHSRLAATLTYSKIPYRRL
jgi:hypothetical protein